MTELTRRAMLGGLSAFVAVPAYAETAWPVRPVRARIKVSRACQIAAGGLFAEHFEDQEEEDKRA